MATAASGIHSGRAQTVKNAFSRETSVSIDIAADPSIIWLLLTTASDFPRWNTAVVSIEGNIAPGQKIRLRSTLDSKRVFKLKVEAFHPEVKLIWGDAMGRRTFELHKKGNGLMLFSMTEKIGGPLFPLFAKMIPSFDQSFDQFAADLKKEAERIMKIK